MKVINARLRQQEGLFSIEYTRTKFTAITPQANKLEVAQNDEVIDAKERLLMPPLVEPHIHLDYVLTAGEPKWNMTGTLFEGIERWGQRKAWVKNSKVDLVKDTKNRALQVVNLLASHGIQYVRTHADTTDPDMIGMKALLEVKDEVKDFMDIQIVAFPQEGIDSFFNGRVLLEQAVQMGADVVGGIPHFEYTRDKGVDSVKYLVSLAEKYEKLIDVHCDETDDPNSRFLEVLADEVLQRGMGSRTTASHTTAMGSYDNAYCFKLFRLLKQSQINFICCPTESIHLQGRYDNYPKRRGLTRVLEIDAAGMNVCFAQDSIRDPWYPIGNGNILRILDAGLHICHMLDYKDLSRCLDFVSINGAKTLNIWEDYGVEVGKPANFIIMNAKDDYEALANQAQVILSVKNGKTIMKRQPDSFELML